MPSSPQTSEADPPASSLQPAASGLQPPASSNDNEVLVKVENVSKIFCGDFKKSLKYGVMDSFSDIFSPRNQKRGTMAQEQGLRPGEFHAVKDVSFELRRGECLGLVGRNGAGKTTLLKMLNGLIKPDRGKITMRGRVGALIALGAGFNPLLTGRENIYINGSVLGFSKQKIDDKFDDIVEFAEIENFIDMPVQSYSSGMQVRLGFAVATAIEPEVLIIDEVLAVGDSRFKAKSLGRISKLLKYSSVIFVSHEESQIQKICDQCLYLDHGKIRGIGKTSEVLKSYNKNKELDHDGGENYQCFSPQLNSVKLKVGSDLVSSGEPIPIKFEIKANKKLKIEEIRIAISHESNRVAVALNRSLEMVCDPGINEILMEITPNCFTKAVYSLEFHLLAAGGKQLLASGELEGVLKINPSVSVQPNFLLNLTHLRNEP